MNFFFWKDFKKYSKKKKKNSINIVLENQCKNEYIYDSSFSLNISCDNLLELIKVYDIYSPRLFIFKLQQNFLRF
jgi:hypothetical protein